MTNLARSLYDRFDTPIAQANCRAAKIRDTGLTHAEYRDRCFAEAAYVYAEMAEVVLVSAARDAELAASLRAIVARLTRLTVREIDETDALEAIGEELGALAARLAPGEGRER